MRRHSVRPADGRTDEDFHHGVTLAQKCSGDTSEPIPQCYFGAVRPLIGEFNSQATGKGQSMPASDALLSPSDLHRRIKKFGLQFQANHRRAGDFPIPHEVIGTRIFYRESDVTAFLAGKAQTAVAPLACGPAPDQDESGERLFDGGDAA